MVKPNNLPPTQLAERQIVIRQGADGLYSLTDLWKTAGSDERNKPAHWQQFDETQGFIKATARFLKCTPDVLFKSKRGKGGGTWAVEQIALEYAQYLDPALAVLVNQVFIERLEEEAKPELAIERGHARAERTWKKQGRSDEWIDKRTVGIAARKAFTGVLARHGVGGNGYRNCTNAIYTPMYGGTSEVVRHKKGLSPGQSIREHMSPVELATISLTETIAAEAIEAQNVHGNGACELICGQTANVIAKSVMAARKAVAPATLTRTLP